MDFLAMAKDLGLPGVALLAFVWFAREVLHVVRDMASQATRTSSEALQANTAALTKLEATINEMYGYMRRMSGNVS